MSDSYRRPDDLGEDGFATPFTQTGGSEAQDAPRQAVFTARSQDPAWITSLLDNPQNRQLLMGLGLFTFVIVLLSMAGNSSGTGSVSSDLSARPRVGFGKPPYKFAVVEDPDNGNNYVNEKGKTVWFSSLKYGILVEDEDSGKWSLVWPDKDEGDDGEVILEGVYNEAGRGLELSELIYWKGELLAADDRTGILYAVQGNKLIPRYVLPEGDGNSPKGTKCEWMTIKGDKLYIGGLGKEFSKDGVITSKAPMFIHTISADGAVEHIDWEEEYTALRRASGTEFPGYMVHEAVGWHAPSNKWVILPRRASTDPFDDDADEEKGSNMMMIASEGQFDKADISYIGEAYFTHGWSSFKWIPGRPDIIAAIRSVEWKGTVEAYLTVFNMNTGQVLLPETKIGDKKYEGLEFI